MSKAATRAQEIAQEEAEKTVEEVVADNPTTEPDIPADEIDLGGAAKDMNGEQVELAVDLCRKIKDKTLSKSEAMRRLHSAGLTQYRISKVLSAGLGEVIRPQFVSNTINRVLKKGM